MQINKILSGNKINNITFRQTKNIYFCAKKEKDKLDISKRNSFIENNKLPIEERIKAGESRGYKTAQTLSKELGIKDSFFERWCEEKVLENESIEISAKKKIYFIDMTNEKTLEALETIKKELPTSISKGEMKSKFGITDSTYKKYAENNELIPVGLKYDSRPSATSGDTLLFNLKNQTNRTTLIKHTRICPKKSKYIDIIRTPGAYIPANYLQALGYANIEQIREDIKKGVVKGKIITKQTDEGIKTKTLVSAETYLGIRDYTDYCRSRNKNTQDAKTFCEKTGITYGRLQRELIQGNVEIIREYLFTDEASEQFIDLTNPKNLEFRNRIIREAEIELELSRLRNEKNSKNTKENQMKLEIIWLLCPEAKEAIDEVAKEYKEVGAIIKLEGKRKNLNQSEEKMLSDYRAKVKEIGEKEGYINARQKAIETARIAKDIGINSISDSKIKNIVKKYY